MEIGRAGSSERQNGARKKSMQNVTQRNGAGDNCADAAAAAGSAAVDARKGAQIIIINKSNNN